MILNRIPAVVNGDAYSDKGRVDLEDLKVIRCCKDTGKCRMMNEGWRFLNEKWECKAGQMYLSPKEILVMDNWTISFNRECFMDVEEGG